MAIRKSSNTGIPFGNTANRPASPAVGQPYFNGEAQRLELYTGAQYGWQNIVAETPGVTGYTGTVAETNSTNTITITGTNFAVGATATLVGQDGTEYAASSTTVNNLTSITAVFGVIPQNNEPYDIRVTNPSNLYGVYYDILTVNDKPVWTTAAGSLGTFNELDSISVTVAATDEENNTITYSLAAGSSLPTGITLNSSTGVISGTLPAIDSDTTYTFTLNASDGYNTSQPRTFSITSRNRISSEYLVVAGGGGGGGITVGGGGGAGGMLTGNYFIPRGSTFSVSVGQGGTGVQQSGTDATNGQNSTLSFVGQTILAYGGGAGGNYAGGNQPGASRPTGASGGSGGGGGDSNRVGGTGISGQGNNGGSSSTTQWAGGGGGGAGQAGSQPSNNSKGGKGGDGLQSSITGTSTYYAGGGGGCSDNAGGDAGLGGGGYGGGNVPSRAGISGTANTGGGGGGTRDNPSGGGPAGNGGSGVVIIAYPDTFPALATIPGTLTYDQPTRSGYRVYRFTSGSGTVTSG